MYLRKGLGGGWRQPGMLAAAANFALDHNVERLAKDNLHAKMIADAISKNPTLELTRRTDSNMVFFSPRNGDFESLSARLTEKKILHSWKNFQTFRLVTHMGITEDMVQYTIDEISNWTSK